MTPTIPLEEIVATLHQLHNPPLDLISPPIFDFQPKNNFVTNRILFAQALTFVPHLFSSGLYGMAYEHHLGCFIPEDPSSRFSKLFQVVVIAHGDIFRSMALMLGFSRLLIMAKDIGGIFFIIVSKVFFGLISHSIPL